MASVRLFCLEKCIEDVEFGDEQVVTCGYNEKNMNGGYFGNGTNCLIVINIGFLFEALAINLALW